MSMIRQVIRGVLVVVAVAGFIGTLLAFDYRNWSQTALHGADTPHTLQVPSGSTVHDIQRQLEEDGLLDRPIYLRLHARLSGHAQRLQSGEYRIPAGMTPPQLLEHIARGRVVQHRFTIIEGWTFQQLRAALEANPRILDTLGDKSDEAVMAELGKPDQHPEGWFYPETYNYTRGTSDMELLKRAHRAMKRRLSAAWEARSDDLPLADAYEALVLASIIERETGAPEERRKVAGVFTRRLQEGMRLQTDPTVIYGMGNDFDGRIRTQDLRTDTPYNTYTRHGLPPTPIAMPSGASLRAAVDPEPGEAMYFVSRGDGTHVFSETLDEHNRAVRRYILGMEE